MFLSVVGKYLKITWEIKKLNLMSEMEYRVSFFIQIFSSIVIHAAFVYLWVLFFQNIPVVEGWDFKDTMLLIAISWQADSLIAIFAGGILKLARTIAQGELDYYLLMPHNLIWHIAVSRTETYALGVIFVTLGMFYLSGIFTIARFILFLMLSVLSAAIIFNFALLTQSIGFFVGNFENAGKKMISALYTFMFYPYNVFTGALRFIATFVIPIYFIGALPSELIINFDWMIFGKIVAFWAVSLCLAMLVFKIGLKRYESGSLIQVKL